MLDVSNRVFSNVMIYVQQRYPDVEFNNTVSAIPESLPAVSVITLDDREMAVDLSSGDPNEDYTIDSNVEIQVYSAKSTDEARKIIRTACDAMRGMAYRRTYGPTEIPLGYDANQYRCVARFQRLVSGLDELPKFTTGDNQL